MNTAEKIEEQKKLIRTIKNPERYFRIEFGRYGGEVAMGRISKEQYDYWSESGDFEEYMGNLAYDSIEANRDVPENARMREFYEHEDICHCNGPELADGQYMMLFELDHRGQPLQNADGSFVEDKTYAVEDLESLGTDIRCLAVHNSSSDSCKNEYFVYGQYFNKGGWQTDDIIKTGPNGFEFDKLRIEYENADGFKVFHSVFYDDEQFYLEEDSTGKSSTFYVMEGDNV